jgi:hypothetical protein
MKNGRALHGRNWLTDGGPSQAANPGMRTGGGREARQSRSGRRQHGGHWMWMLCATGRGSDVGKGKLGNCLVFLRRCFSLARAAEEGQDVLMPEGEAPGRSLRQRADRRDRVETVGGQGRH